MYLEMLQQRYGTGFEKSSATLAGRMLRSLGRGVINPKLHNKITTGLQNSGISALQKGTLLLNSPTSKLGRTAGHVLRSLGKGMINPKLHNKITTGLQGSGRAAYRVGSKLLYNPSTKLGFNVGGAAGLGTGALAGTAGYGLYRTLSGPKQDTADPQQSNPETNIPDLHKRVLDFSKHMLITNPAQGSSFNSTGY